MTLASVPVNGTGGKILFAGTYVGGIFRSTDNGASWSDVHIKSTSGTVFAFASNIDSMGKATIFAGTSGGIFFSTDNGTNWANTGFSLPVAVNALLVMPGSGGGTRIFAGTEGADAGIVLSTNNGAKWASSNQGISGNYVNALAAVGTVLFAGTYQDGVYRSTDNGKTWAPMNTGMTGGSSVTALSVNGSSLYAATYGDGIYRTTNNGGNWSHVVGGLTDAYVNALAFNSAGSRLLTGTETGVFRTGDTGTSWSAVNVGLPYLGVNALAFSADGARLYAGTTGGGVCWSTDNGATWQAPNTGLKKDDGTTVSVYALALMGTTVFAGTDGNGGVYRSTDNGVNWTGSQSGLPNNSVKSLFVNGSSVIAGMYGGGVYTSTNNGSTWKETDAGLPSVSTVNAFVQISTTLFAGTGGNGVYRSTDNGSHWTPLNSGLPSRASIQSLAESAGGTSQLIAGTEGDGVYISTNAGASWTAANTGFPQGVVVNALAVVGGSLFAGTEGDSVFVSTNSGATWGTANRGLTEDTVNVFAVNPMGMAPTNLYAGTGSSGVFRYTSSVSLKSSIVLNKPGPASVGTPFWVEVRIGEPTAVNGLYGVSFKVKSDKPTCTYVDGSAAVGTFPDAGVLTYFKMADPQTVDMAISKTATPGMSGSGLVAKAQFLSSAGGSVRFTIEGLTAIDQNGTSISLDTMGLSISFGGPVARLVGVGPYQMGKPFWIQVQIGDPDTIKGLYGISFKLKSDKIACTYVDGSATAGTLLGTSALTFFQKADPQTVDMALTKTASPGVTGTGVIAKAEFVSSLTGAVTFTLVEVSAIDQNGVKIPLGAESFTIASILTAIAEESREPTSFQLSQNYPNPFNPSTNFEFQVPSSGFVSLKVFDVLGREAATLVNEMRTPGIYRVRWNASAMPSGVYVYRLRAGSLVSTKQMVLLK